MKKPTTKNSSKRQRTIKNDLPLPSDQTIKNLSDILLKQFNQKQTQQKYAPVSQVLTLLGRGAVLGAAILAPKTASYLLPLVKNSSDWDEWKHYNISYLKRTIWRLEKAKQVEITFEKGKERVFLTQNGKRKILRYSIDSLAIEKPKHWDDKWRLVLYDIPDDHSHTRDFFREILRGLGFYCVQESVYIFPYPCFDQIEFLRQFYFLKVKVQYMLVDHIENDDAFKDYFGLS